MLVGSLSAPRLASFRKRALFYSLLCLATIGIWFSPVPLLREIALPAIFFYFPVSLCHLITTLLSGNQTSMRLPRRHINVLNAIVALTGVALVFWAMVCGEPIIAQIGIVMLLVIPEMYLANVEDMSRREVSHDNPLQEPMTERWVFRTRFQHYCGIALILAGAHFAPLPSLWGLIGHPTLAALSLSLLAWITLTYSQGRMAVRLRHSISDVRIKWLYLALFLAAIGCIGIAATTRNEALSKMGLLLLLLIFELQLLHKECREKVLLAMRS